MKLQDTTRRFFIYALVFATGAAGLMYQVAWHKYLGRLLGSDSMATAIILAAFLGGLSMGYVLCGRFTTRVKNCFRTYGLLEGVIGGWGLLFPYLFSAVEAGTGSWSFAPPVTIVLQGFACTVMLTGIPTLCMGATIPFLTRGLSATLAAASRVHARIYAINTAGAFLGSLAAGFFLIPSMGLPLTVQTAAFLNLGAALFFLLTRNTAARASGDTADSNAHDPQAPPSPYPAGVLYGIAFISGMYVMSLENVFIRLTGICLGSSSYSYAMIVAVFVLAIAAGSYGVGMKKEIKPRSLCINQLLITLCLAALYVGIDTWPYGAHLIRIASQSNEAGFWVYYLLVFLSLCSVLLLPVALMGATVPLVFNELKKDLHHVGHHSGVLFSWNTAGNLAGSLTGGIVLYRFLDTDGVFTCTVFLAAGSACLAARFISTRLLAVCSVVCVGVLTLLFYQPLYDESRFVFGTFRIRHILDSSLQGPRAFFSSFTKKHKVLFHRDGPFASVSVVEGPSGGSFDRASRAIFINGKSDSDTTGDIYTLRLSAHLPALLARHRKSVLVIGLGTGVTAGELTLYDDITRIDVAEISPTVVDALPLFSPFNYSVSNDPRINIHVGDAFRLLRNSGRTWDIIISEPSNPWVSGVDLLFTREFYRLARQHLAPSGMLLQWAQMYAADEHMLGMILATVRHVFREVRVFMSSGADLLILASDSPVTGLDISRATRTLAANSRVGASLDEINLGSVPGILVREIWSPAYITDHFSSLPVQTMDNPRLHYIAGKKFFMGKPVPARFLFSTTTAAYYRDFLLCKLYKNWQQQFLSEDVYRSLVLSSRNRGEKNDLPLAPFVKLKAHLGNQERFVLTELERKRFRPELIPLIASRPANEEAWAAVGLGGASFQAKARVLLRHVYSFRNWISMYPVDGLVALLEQGIVAGKDVYEQNWCVLQLAALLQHEREPAARVQSVLKRAVRNGHDQIIVRPRDEAVFNQVEAPRR